MPSITIETPGYKCTRCNHEWIPVKDEKPTVCPKCKSPYWDRPKAGTWGRRELMADIARERRAGQEGE